jgi:hypothetical protein
MITAITFIIIGILSLAGGIGLFLLALDTGNPALILMATGSVASGLVCFLGGTEDCFNE